MRILLATLLASFIASPCLVGCGGSQPAAEAPSSTPDSSPASPAESETPARPELTAEACEASGGTVVGEIGDGAIHRPDYRCANGAEPSGSIRAAEGGPIAVEGSVCCPQ